MKNKLYHVLSKSPKSKNKKYIDTFVSAKNELDCFFLIIDFDFNSNIKRVYNKDYEIKNKI